MASLFEKLSSQLLDLGNRNKLLNFKDLKLRSIEIISPNADALLDNVLTQEALMFVRSDNEDNEDDINDNQYALSIPQEANKHQLIAYKRHESYERILRSLKKFNDEAMVEKGINILYLAFGFLSWQEADFSRYSVKSPLLLVPVTLEYSGAIRTYILRKFEDEVIVNPALSSKLELDFGFSLPEFYEDSDTFNSYLNKVSNLIHDKDWTLSEDAYLGVFSFAKLTMYRDLKDNGYLMEAQDNVRAIYNEEVGMVDTYFDSDYDEFFKESHDIELHNVVDADSSQIKAILEAKKGKSFVIQGPPGTGKSQTITNIIAELLANKKNVLFVSEKIAALNVVYNNLDKVGLGDYCLQIHSDKSDKKTFVQEIYRVLHSRVVENNNRHVALEELKQYKDELDKYCEVLYKNIDVVDDTPYSILAKTSFYKKYDHSIDYKISNIQEKDKNFLYKQKSLLERFSNTNDKVTRYWEHPWYGFNGDKYLLSELSNIKDNINFAIQYIAKVVDMIEKLASLIGVNIENYDQLTKSGTLLNSINDLKVEDQNLFDKYKREKIIELIEEYIKYCNESKEDENTIFDAFNEDVLSLDLNSLYAKFKGPYNSIFRGFNKQYKGDIALIDTYRKNNNPLKYRDYKRYIEIALRYKGSFNRKRSVLSSLNEITDIDYASIDDLVNVLESIKAFDTTIKKSIIIKEGFVYSTLKEVVSNLLELINDEENNNQYLSIQDYFDIDLIDLSNNIFADLLTIFKKCSKEFNSIVDWSRFYDLYKELKQHKLLTFIYKCLITDVDKNDLSHVYSYIYYDGWLNYIYEKEPTLRSFRRETQDYYVKKFKNADRNMLKLTREYISNVLGSNIKKYTSGYYDPSNLYVKEAAIIDHEANKKRRIKPIRTLLKEAGYLIHAVKPCFLMSPLSVASYLTYNPDSFDTVIFDEASQIFPWDAIGAISRSKQVIVVGDTKQMPPTNFFMTSSIDYDEEYSEEDDENVKDYESILDLASGALPQTLLNWHYRSKNEDLIAFSNMSYYGNRLTTFPSQHKSDGDFGINFHYVPGAVFTSRKNVKEAEEVIKLIYDHFKRHPERSLGVVCFSISQQQLLEELLENKRRSDDRYADLFSNNVNERFFIKNLETVQGDERDTIIFSIGYGKDPTGVLKHNFGPLNRVGGERRLNVAITRAKYNVKVVSSIKASDIDLNRTKAEGARLLKEYLDYAERGAAALYHPNIVNDNAEAESGFEEEVASFIKDKGYKVDLQVGCSGYRIDMCVKHPKTNDYVLAVECDGATYHSSLNTRDRDRLRQEVLEKLGWRFYRIWSTDWFMNNISEKEYLLKAIEEAIAKYDEEQAIKEQKRQEEIELRLKEANKKDEEEQKIVTKELTKASFFDSLSDNYKVIISDFNRLLDGLGHDFIKTNTDSNYGYRLRKDYDNGENRFWFWFSKDGAKLIFKYRGYPGSDEYRSLYVSNATAPFNNVKPTILFRAYSNTTTKVEHEDKKKNDSLWIYYQIVQVFKKRNIKASPKEKELVYNIYDYVMERISMDAISRRYFKDKDEFDQYKYSRRITYNFYGTHFSLGGVTTSNAKVFYEYYKVSRIIEKIKSYEMMFNLAIIDNYDEATISIRDLLAEKDYQFSKIRGVNSNFQLVPEITLEQVAHSFDIFE